MSLLVATAILIFLIGGFGIFGNVNLFIASAVRNPHRNKCTILISILSCVDFLSICFEFQNAIRILVGAESHRVACFWTFSPYLFCINVQSFLILMIAVDRLLAMFVPLRYRNLSTTVYVLLAMMPCVVFAAAIFTGALVYMVDEPIRACNPPLTYPPMISKIWNRWIVLFDCCTLVVYTISMVVLYIKKSHFKKLGANAAEHQFFMQQRHIMNTIGVIVVAFVFTAFFCHCSVLIVTLTDVSEVVQVFQTVAVIPAIISYCQNYYIYLWRSKEYRAAFKRQLMAILQCDWGLCGVHNSVSMVHSAYSSHS